MEWVPAHGRAPMLHWQLKGETDMCDPAMTVKIGQKVPSFEIEIYDSAKGDFGTVGLEKLKSEGKWIILFFYPADFTFV